MRWWDPAAHMVWNPPGSLDEHLPERSVHLVPQTAWLAYGLLGDIDAARRAEGRRAIEALIDLQYDAPGTAFHGTFAMFLESQYPPAAPTVWVDYDPNWRQFLGTTFALIVDDFGRQLDADLLARIVASIGLACEGELDGRIAVHYTNPALMRSWLDAWYGRRVNNAALVARGEQFARAVVAEHDRHDAFDEFNSPTYYGIDLYALRLWELLPPTPFFETAGTRIAARLCEHAADFYNPMLRNFCGPFTRSYHPDATRSLQLFALWMWAANGRDTAPLPDLTADDIDHGHDLMAGPLFARLAPERLDGFAALDGPRELSQQLSIGRAVTAHVEPHLMLGAEASDLDWGGWVQFMPLTAQWADGADVATLWLTDPHVVRAHVVGRTIDLETARTGAPTPDIAFELIATACTVTADGLATPTMTVTIDGDHTKVSVEAIGANRFRITIAPAESTPTMHLTLTFHPLTNLR
jgi:hypothetical protein